MLGKFGKRAVRERAQASRGAVMSKKIALFWPGDARDIPNQLALPNGEVGCSLQNARLVSIWLLADKFMRIR